MTMAAGTRIGPYEIVSRIGAGGMGEVFRARDTRLERTVALKMLPAALAANPDMRLRLQREARAISSLSHPNICSLFDIGEQDGIHYLVMEHLEGETLADRLERGPLPLRDALRYGNEIANALERAHRAGVVHRDLKPGNVMITKSGAKLLDFGLAKGLEEGKIVSADAPTMQARQPLTAEGTIVGTFQYMAPEQLEAAVVDARTDIFALGALLYEMVTGQRAFSGKTRTSLIASIVAATPRPMSQLQPVTPVALENVVARCLEKDPDARWQSAHDVALELDFIARQVDAPLARPKRNALPWALAALAAVAAIAAGWMALPKPAAGAARPLYAQILPPPARDLAIPGETLSMSPDGRYVTYRVTRDQRLWLRPLSANDARPLEGTEGAGFPFWSPDSKSIGFVAQEKLKRVSVSGTPPVVICDAPKGRPGAWSDDGVILFAPSSLDPLYRVSIDEGKAEPLTRLASNETTHRWPTFLPDGKHFLYLAATHTTPATDDGAIYVAPLDAPDERKLLVRARSNAVYARGHLLYAKGRQLLAHPFDPASRKLTGDPFPIASNVAYDVQLFRSSFAVSDDGALIFHPASNPREAVLMRHDPPAPAVEIMKPDFEMSAIVLSPDRQKVATRAIDQDTGMADLWVFDLLEKSKSRVTSTGELSEWMMVWSPDSKRLAYSHSKGLDIATEIAIATIDSSEPVRVVHREAARRSVIVTDWSDDGRYLMYMTMEPGKDATADLFVLPVAEGSKPIAIASTAASEGWGTFSPDGNWVVFESNLGGKNETYARSLLRPDSSPVPLGLDGGAWWFGDVFLSSAPDGVTAYSVVITPQSFKVGSAQALTPWPAEFDFADTDGKFMVYTSLKPNVYTQSFTLLTDWSSSAR